MPATPVDLYDRCHRSCETARSLKVHAARLALLCSTTRDRSVDIRRQSIVLRDRDGRRALLPVVEPPSRAPPSSFVIFGEVDGEIATALWSRQTGLICPAELYRRAEVVVAMGDTFCSDDGQVAVLASLDDRHPSTVLVTVLRAFSRVLSVDVTVRPGPGQAAGE